MADFLTSVKSVRIDHDKETSESLLTAVKSSATRSKNATQVHEQHRNSDPQNETVKNSKPTKLAENPDEVLQILRSQPDQDDLITTLSQLHGQAFKPSFNIHAPGPQQAQIIHTLLVSIVPDFWEVLSQKDQDLLVSCLRNVAGCNAVVARLRLLASSKQSKDDVDSHHPIKIILDVADRLMTGDTVLSHVWRNLQDAVPEKVKQEMSWKEFINLIGSGKVIAAAAQAEDSIKLSFEKPKSHWFARGSDYAAWLGRNVASVIDHVDDGAEDMTSTKAGAQIISKALNLGYQSSLLHALFRVLVKDEVQSIVSNQNGIGVLLECLPAHTKRSFIEHTLRWFSGLSDSELVEAGTLYTNVSALAAFLVQILSDTGARQNILSFLIDPVLSSWISTTAQRAILAALAESSGDQNEDELQDLLEKLLSIFSDRLFINHASIIQQESVTKIILVVAACIQKKNPMALLVTARSSNHMQGVSNRLDSSNSRARWLGMIVGTAVSSLVDKEGSKMNFGTEDMQSDEAEWYLNLVKVQDRVGSLSGFHDLLESREKAIVKPARQNVHQTRSQQMPKLNGKQVFGPVRPPVPVQTEVIGEKVTELNDDESENSNNLKPYAKPDSDPEDSDEDATLVNRNKARPPVYIRDLMAMLRDDQSHDRFQLGVKHAASLIRRKSNFGAEVKDHAEEIAAILCNLQDPFETEGFDELKLQALIAVLLSDVKIMAPWLSRQAFIGEYSIAQRCIMLSALGLGGRELAGQKNDDEDFNPAIDGTDFPSKRLPPRLQAIYGTPISETSTKRLEAASKSIEHALIKPLAMQAADQSTSHLNAVKVRTFSSRRDVERTKRKPAANQLAKIFASTFFLPLTNRYQHEIAAYGSSSVFASVPMVLVTFVKTLALLFHASGPATMDLPAVSAEFWDLLLSLRVQAIKDITILQAVLFGLLTLLEMNENRRRIAEEHPKQLMETQQWVNLILEKMGDGGGLVKDHEYGDEEKVRTLAAGVLVKTNEVISAYQKQLVGYNFD